MHRIVQAGGYPNATGLARELEVCTKSVHRDLEFMRDRLGLPLEFDRHRNGYHYTQEVNAFPTLQITEGELFALLVAEKAVQQYRGTNFERPLLSALRKMAEALPDTVSQFLIGGGTLRLHLSAGPFLVALAVVAAVSIIATLLPIRVATRITPLAAMSDR